MNALAKIQAELKVPKNQENKFGGYKYRSCEDILEAVKPLLKKHESLLTISDDVIEIGGRVYVKATAYFESDGYSKEVKAYAREPESKKGSDESQITGAASSYARKYALNGLFCIDDTKDADATNDHGREEKPKGVQPKVITAEQVAALESLAAEVGADIKAFCSWMKIPDLSHLPAERHQNAVTALEKKRKAA